MSALFLADGSWLGVHWSVMKVIGWAGNLLFFSRFVIQWLATERKKTVVVPVAFWYCSLGGSLLLLIYALSRRDSVFVFAYLFTWIPYIRNLHFAHRDRRLTVAPLADSAPAETVAPPGGR